MTRTGSGSFSDQALALLWEIISTVFTSALYSVALWCGRDDAIAPLPASSGSIVAKKWHRNGRGGRSGGEGEGEGEGEGDDEDDDDDDDDDDESSAPLPPVSFYKGTVWHERKAPCHHKFSYTVRYALIDLDHKPSPLGSNPNHLSASQARSIAGSDGPVYLMTVPPSVGYEQNPLSVYYCFKDDKISLFCCIAEVTNTPWGERVTFLFNPQGDLVSKSLHVSPFMDMSGEWMMKTRVPGKTIGITITVKHPEFGNFFVASLSATRVEGIQTSVEKFFWLMPHKTALGIYWQAFLLWWKGVKFLPHPKDIDGDQYRVRAMLRDQHNLKEGKTGLSSCPVSGQAPCSRSFAWTETHWPWT